MEDNDNVPEIKPQKEPPVADPELVSYEEKRFDPTERDIQNLRKKR